MLIHFFQTLINKFSPIYQINNMINSQQFKLNFKKQMRTNQQRKPNFGAYRIASNFGKPTNIPIQPHINNININNTNNNKDYRCSDRSRQFQNERIMNQKSKKKTQRKQQYEQYQTSTGTKIRNPRQLKNTHSDLNIKRHDSQRQNSSHGRSYGKGGQQPSTHSQPPHNNSHTNYGAVYNNNGYSNRQPQQQHNQNQHNQHHQQQSQDQVQGILINVNIQDLIGPRHIQNIQNIQNISNYQHKKQSFNMKSQSRNNQKYNSNSSNVPLIPNNNQSQNPTQNHNKSYTSNNSAINNVQYVSHKISQNYQNVVVHTVENKKMQGVSNRDRFDSQLQCTQEIIYTRRTSPHAPMNTGNPVTKTDKNQQLLYQKPSQKQKNSPLPISTPQPHPQPLPPIPPTAATPIISIKQQISLYLQTLPDLASKSSSQSLIHLDTLQSQYRISPKYIEQSQPNFTWQMRAYVIQWMMQVSEEFGLKRETFHIAVNLLDRYLSKERGLPKSGFQVIGAASMFIASKLEEFQPRTSEDFAITTGRLVTATKLKQTQLQICQTLQYKLNPPTLWRWTSRLLLQWDTYIDSPLCSDSQFFSSFPRAYFKQNDQQSYKNYRLIQQLIDCAALDIQTWEYSAKLVVCSFLYLYLLTEYKIYTSKQISSKFPDSSQYLFYDPQNFNFLFTNFLQFTFGFPLQDLLPTIQYCAGFLILPQNVDPPAYVARNQKLCQSMGLEQYQSYQTFDRNMIKAVVKRRKMYNNCNA